MASSRLPASEPHLGEGLLGSLLLARATNNAAIVPLQMCAGLRLSVRLGERLLTRGCLADLGAKRIAGISIARLLPHAIDADQSNQAELEKFN